MKRIKATPCEITCLKRTGRGAQRDRGLATKVASGWHSVVEAKSTEPQEEGRTNTYLPTTAYPEPLQSDPAPITALKLLPWKYSLT